MGVSSSHAFHRAVDPNRDSHSQPHDADQRQANNVNAHTVRHSPSPSPGLRVGSASLSPVPLSSSVPSLSRRPKASRSYQQSASPASSYKSAISASPGRMRANPSPHRFPALSTSAPGQSAAAVGVDSECLPDRAQSPVSSILVTFSERDRGNSVLFKQFKPFQSVRGPESLIDASAVDEEANKNNTQQQQQQQQQDINNTHTGSGTPDSPALSTVPSSANLTSLASPNPALANRVYSAAATGRHPFSTLDLSILAPEEGHPRYTRLVRLFLMSIGLVPFRSKFLRQNPSLSYIFPSFIFMFLLANVVFITIDSNNSSVVRRNAGLSIVSGLISNIAPFASWVGCYYYIGVSKLRAEHLFTQLANLESYDPKIARNTTIGSILAGIVLIGTTNLSSIPTNLGTVTPFTLLNVFLFLFLNYLITTFVIILLCSLICRFHTLSLRLFIVSLVADEGAGGLDVVELLRDHCVLMRLVQQTASYVQWVLGLPLLLYITTALIASFQMLSTGIYSNLSQTAFTMTLAILMLMIPLYFAAQVTSECKKIKEIALTVDMSDYLMERQTFIQQLVLYPQNGLYLFGFEIRFTLLFQVAYLVVAVIFALVRGGTGGF